ncbi:LD-carboxypeptidase [Spiroplasma endosymbiont of Aspidapion aeneum]|uniref:LD-carboxypeptidase n=1 Tax=Spiroplasma endosymbiont of Aspidapion aeneum TaxID=3066276 RepID=UPI00313AC540
MKIGIFSCSSPGGSNFPIRLNRALKKLENYGNEIICGKLIRGNNYYRTATINDRADEFNSLISSNVDILMSSIGGSNSNSIVDKINYNMLNKINKKLIVCGYSDTTVILLAILRKCKKIRVLYGPALISTFGDWEEEFVDYTYKDFVSVIEKKSEVIVPPKHWTDDIKNWSKYEGIRNIKINDWKFLGFTKNIKGRVIGGNLSALIGTYGSEYGLNVKKGDILLIEDSCKNAEIIEKNFSFLLLNKIFNKCSAILLGKHERFDDQGSKINSIDILNEVLKSRNMCIPIVYDVDFAHTKPMSIIELNSTIEIDFINKKIKKIY